MAIALSETAIARIIRRLSTEICDWDQGAEDIALVGIRRGGVPLANRISNLIFEQENVRVPIGTVDITLYRDDAATALPNPQIGRSAIAFDVKNKTIILVDDVLFTGRTARAAIDAILDYGRPRSIELLALVDRGHRELPIAANYVGAVLTTLASEHVDVHLGDDPSQDAVTVSERT
jgi:pyrimidine operon attenuation protein/uracil phosphoribosyltransferase